MAPRISGASVSTATETTLGRQRSAGSVAVLASNLHGLVLVDRHTINTRQ